MAVQRRTPKRLSPPTSIEVFRASALAAQAGKTDLADQLWEVWAWWRDNGRPTLSEWPGALAELWEWIEEASP